MDLVLLVMVLQDLMLLVDLVLEDLELLVKE